MFSNFEGGNYLWRVKDLNFINSHPIIWMPISGKSTIGEPFYIIKPEIASLRSIITPESIDQLFDYAYGWTKPINKKFYTKKDAKIVWNLLNSIMQGYNKFMEKMKIGIVNEIS